MVGVGDEPGSCAYSRTRIGGWAVVRSPILNTTITVDRLMKRGYQAMLAMKGFPRTR